MSTPLKLCVRTKLKRLLTNVPRRTGSLQMLEKPVEPSFHPPTATRVRSAGFCNRRSLNFLNPSANFNRAPLIYWLKIWIPTTHSDWCRSTRRAVWRCHRGWCRRTRRWGACRGTGPPGKCRICHRHFCTRPSYCSSTPSALKSIQSSPEIPTAKPFHLLCWAETQSARAASATTSNFIFQRFVTLGQRRASFILHIGQVTHILWCEIRALLWWFSSLTMLSISLFFTRCS